jgi:hypothetical protein
MSFECLHGKQITNSTTQTIPCKCRTYSSGKENACFYGIQRLITLSRKSLTESTQSSIASSIMALNVAVQWSVFLFRIREVLGSNLGPKICYPNRILGAYHRHCRQNLKDRTGRSHQATRASFHKLLNFLDINKTPYSLSY